MKEGQARLWLVNQAAGSIEFGLAKLASHALGRCAILTGRRGEVSRAESEDVVVIRAPHLRRGNTVVRVLSWFRYLAVALLTLSRQRRGTFALLSTNPPVTPFLGLVIRLWGIRYGVHVLDVYPDIAVRLGKLDEKAFTTWLWRKLNRLAYERADFVAVCGRDMADRLAGQFDVSRTRAGKIIVAYPGVDVSSIRPIAEERNWFAQQLGLGNKLTIMYSGNMGLAHDIETVLAAAIALRNDAEVHFLFIGGGPKWQLVQHTQSAERLGNVTVLSWQPESIFPFSLAAGDVAVVSMVPGTAGLLFPSKTGAAMAAGSAVLALSNAGSELRRIVDEHGCGLCVEPGDVDGFVKAVLAFRNDRDYLARCRASARRTAEMVFRSEISAEPLMTAIASAFATV
jgi:glycosyltransferase involved in cell wall biosynthesis